MLPGFVLLHLVISIGIYAATKAHNAKDYIVMAMAFATWFGAETVPGTAQALAGTAHSGIV